MRNQLWGLAQAVSSKIRLARGRRLAVFATIFVMCGAGALLAVGEGSNEVVPRFQEFSDPEGRFANFNAGGPTDISKNAFFQDLGSNGRRCVTCHRSEEHTSELQSRQYLVCRLLLEKTQISTSALTARHSA